jgi:hypothetical protein
VRSGPEFQLNTYTSSTQRDTAVASLSGGGFVAVWRSFGQDGDLGGIYGQVFDNAGNKVGSEFRANTRTAGNQVEPSVAGLDDGTFVVAWSSATQDGDESGELSDYGGVYGQRFSASGSPLGAEFRVNSYLPSFQDRPSVAGLASGGFVVVWESFSQDGSAEGIYAQIFGAGGGQIGTEFIVNTTTANYQERPKVARLSGGGFAVVWHSNLQDGDSWGVFARVFTDAGAPLTDEIPVNTTTSGRQDYPAVVGLSNGSFVVAWQSKGQDGSGTGLFARRFSAAGVPLSSEVPVNTHADRDHDFVALVAGVAGEIHAYWRSRLSGQSMNTVFSQRFASDMTKLGPEVVAPAVPDFQVFPAGARLSATKLVVTWHAADGESYGQIYRRTGAPLALDDTAVTTTGTPVSVPVLDNDADPDPNDTLTVTLASATHGSVIINGNNTLTYTPPAGCGMTSDAISYTIQDSSGNTASATVTVTITLAPAMTVTPATTTRLYGPVGGPFPPPYGTYTVTNTGCGSLPFVARADDDWLARIPASGTLAAGASQEVMVRPSASAAALAVGTYTTRVRFVNRSNRIGNASVPVILSVLDSFGHNTFASAPVLSGPSGTAWSSNVGRNGQAGEPNHGGVSLPLASVWWSWTAPATGRAVFATNGSSFDTVLAVYTGGAVNALTLVAANDDFSTIAPQSRVSFNAVAGTTYRIAVDGKGSAEGLVKLNWSMP